MILDWQSTNLISLRETLDVLTELDEQHWLCRGQSKPYGCLIPSIDREPRQTISRAEKLTMERKSIDTFQSTVRFFADSGEEGSKTNDLITLMVLQHYGVPTRLLDWSRSPLVAAYFACLGNDKEAGELWTFNESLYEIEGAKQWTRWPETQSNESTDPNKFSPASAFLLKEPPDWFVCQFYDPGFHRQKAQQGAFTMTARFGQDHAASIRQLLKASSNFHLYHLEPALKPKLRSVLMNEYKIWRGTLFPDSAGAAETSRQLVFPVNI